MSSPTAGTPNNDEWSKSRKAWFEKFLRIAAGREDFAGWIEVWVEAVKAKVGASRAAGAKSRKGKPFVQLSLLLGW